MLLDFFVWHVKKVRNIYRNRHAVVGRQLLVRLFLTFSGFRECMWLILKTLRCFGRHISFVWFDSNLLQQVSVAVVQISDRISVLECFPSAIFRVCYCCKKIFLVMAVRFLVISLRQR